MALRRAEMIASSAANELCCPEDLRRRKEFLISPFLGGTFSQKRLNQRRIARPFVVLQLLC